MREILLWTEQFNPDDGDDHKGYATLEEVLDAHEEPVTPDDLYQLILMKDAGWITGKHAEHGVYRITSLGHDYLDAIRDEGIWMQTKSAISATGGSATLEIFKALATGFLKKKIEKHTGIEL